MKKKTLLLMLVLMFISTNALSQNTIYGNISGDVQEGITVNIYHLTCGVSQPYADSATDEQGYYTIGGLPSGRYLVGPEDADYTFAPGGSWVDIPQDPIQPYDFTAVETVQSFNMPMAICEEAVTDSSGYYNCNIGRVFNDNTDTARWTNFENCDGGVPHPTEISDLIDCDAGANPAPIALGSGIATTNGVLPPVSHQLHECFFGEGTEPPRVMNVTLPVIDCGESPTCGVVVGAVNVDIVWITKSTIDPAFYNAPTEIYSAGGEELLWQYADNGTNGEARWANFVEYFNLQDVAGGEPALYRNFSIYFKPSCDDVDSK
jgi:hypothetical protein